MPTPYPSVCISLARTNITISINKISRSAVQPLSTGPHITPIFSAWRAQPHQFPVLAVSAAHPSNLQRHISAIGELIGNIASLSDLLFKNALGSWSLPLDVA